MFTGTFCYSYESYLAEVAFYQNHWKEDTATRNMYYLYRFSYFWENIEQLTCATILVREPRVTYTRVISSCQISARNTVQTRAITAANVVCKRSPKIASTSKQKKRFISGTLWWIKFILCLDNYLKTKTWVYLNCIMHVNTYEIAFIHMQFLTYWESPKCGTGNCWWFHVTT